MLKASSLSNFTTAQIQKFERALRHTNLLLSFKFFRTALRGIPSFENNPGVTGTDVDQKLQTDVSIEFYIYHMPWYRWWSSEICRESAGKVGIRDTYFNSATTPQLVNSIAHEALHALGFSHDYYPSSRRDDSVPYKVGAMFEQWADTMTNISDQTKKEVESEV